MSRSEVYVFGKDGYAHFYGEVQNANAGSMAVWKILEMKYLPEINDPYWKMITRGEYVSRLFVSMCDSNNKSIREIWDLAKSDSPLTDDERIVLCCTLDSCLVKKDFLPSVIRAYENFEGSTNLKDVADILKKACDDPDVLAVGFAISLSSGWADRGLLDPEDPEERLPYNIFTQKDHWFLELEDK